MFGCFEIMPSTLGELLKCEQIYKIIYARTFFAVIIFAKSGQYTVKFVILVVINYFEHFYSFFKSSHNIVTPDVLV